MTLMTRVVLIISRNHEAMANRTNLGYQETEALNQSGNWHGAIASVVVLEPIFQYADRGVYMPPRSIQNYHGSVEGNGTGAISRFSGKSGRVQFLDVANLYSVYVHPVQFLDSDGTGNNPTADKLSPQLAAIEDTVEN